MLEPIFLWFKNKTLLNALNLLSNVVLTENAWYSKILFNNIICRNFDTKHLLFEKISEIYAVTYYSNSTCYIYFAMHLDIIK